MANIGPNINLHRNHKKMGGGKRTPEQKKRDLEFCTNLFLKCYTYDAIADALNERNEEEGYTMSRIQVMKDIKGQLEQWKKDAFDNIDAYVQQELRKLDKIENELWDAWEASKQGKRKTKIAGGSIRGSSVDGGTVKERNIETTLGNPKYLDLILDVQRRRAKLLGYDAPTKLDIHHVDNTVEKDEQEYNFDAIPEDVMSKMVEAMMRENSKKANEDKSTINL